MSDPPSWGIGGFLFAGRGERGRRRIGELLHKAGLSFSVQDWQTRINVQTEDDEFDMHEDVDAKRGLWFFSGGAGVDEGAARRLVGRLTDVLTEAKVVHHIELTDPDGDEVRLYVHFGWPRGLTSDQIEGS